MGFTTYAAFVPALMDMTVSGVEKTLDEPPSQIATLPLMYPRLPTGDGAMEAFHSSAGLLSGTCEVVIVIEALRQNLQSVNFAAALAMMDALSTALKTNAGDIGIDSWQMQVEQDIIGDTAYWLLVATVEASG